MKNCTPLWREAHLEVKAKSTSHLQHCWKLRCKAHQRWSTFGSSDVEKVHAVMARSTCPSQHVQSTPCPDHFWKFRCRKSARRCGAKCISNSKKCKTDGPGPLLEDSEKVQAVVARSTFPSQKCKKLTVSDDFLMFRCRKSAHKSAH